MKTRSFQRKTERVYPNVSAARELLTVLLRQRKLTSKGVRALKAMKSTDTVNMWVSPQQTHGGNHSSNDGDWLEA